jgi:hypothetical protein
VTECDESAEVLAEVHKPYFSRTVGHFCGHKNTPHRPEAAEYPALVRCGNVMYFAHPVFESYNETGNFILEGYVRDAIERVYSKAIVTSELPSSGRIRIRESKDGDFLAMHVLYAPPVNRGNVCLLPDFPKLYDVSVKVRVEREITSVTREPDGEPIEFTKDGDYISFKLPPFRLHTLIVMK